MKYALLLHADEAAWEGPAPEAQGAVMADTTRPLSVDRGTRERLVRKSFGSALGQLACVLGAVLGRDPRVRVAVVLQL